MFNELVCIESLMLIVLIFLNYQNSLLMTWYLGGVYLILIGLLALIDNGDIFIGFLWVIDLGVGLIFLLFVLHFSNFLNSKTHIIFSNRNSVLLLPSILTLWLLFTPLWLHSEMGASNVMANSFIISWYDYYEIFLSLNVTDLNLLREIYFFNNSFEFFLINFLLFFGICLSILLTFFIRKQVNILALDQFLTKPFLKQMNTTFFIRNQNLMTQQNASTGSRLWKKNASNLIINVTKTNLN